MKPPPRFSSLVYERWFAALLPDYQGDVNCTLEFDGHVDESRLRQAFLAALATEPMWSYRFVTHWWMPYWEPIPRADRPKLLSVEHFADDAARMLAWERILNRRVDAAVRVHVLRTPQKDHVLFRVDHCLADAGAARQFVDVVAENYQRATPAPENDGPVIRRTTALLRPAKDWRRRLGFLKEVAQFLKRCRSGRGFHLPLPTDDDPIVPPQFLHYPLGSADQLATRAMRDRATSAMVMMAVAHVALRDLVEYVPDVEWPIMLPVNLRRYLPPDQQSAPASLLTGQVAVWVSGRDLPDLSTVLEQIRSQLASQRGPDFGLGQSSMALDLPVLRTLMHWKPFAWSRRDLKRMDQHPKKTPMVLISDLGEYRCPGEDWGGAAVTNGYCTQGTFRMPSIMIGMSSCGTRLTLAVGSGPGSFVRRFSERVDFHLSRYVGWEPLLTTAVASESSA